MPDSTGYAKIRATRPGKDTRADPDRKGLAMAYGDPEIEQTPPCRACGCRKVFCDLAPPGERERPVFLRCCRCGRERDDLEFYEEPGRGAEKSR